LPGREEEGRRKRKKTPRKGKQERGRRLLPSFSLSTYKKKKEIVPGGFCLLSLSVVTKGGERGEGRKGSLERRRFGGE